MPQNLKLVLEHLNAARELDRYLRKKGLDKDLDSYIKEVFCSEFEKRLPALKLWRCERYGTNAEWYPSQWELPADLHISLWVFLPNPFTDVDDDPSVNLLAPPEWPGFGALNDRSRRWVKVIEEEGFGLRCDHDSWVDNGAMGKYVSWLNRGSFAESDLVERLVLEAERIVRLEPEITKTLSEFAA